MRSSGRASILTTEMTRALLDGAEPYLSAGSPAPLIVGRAPPLSASDLAPGSDSLAAPSFHGGTATYVYGIASADADELAGALARGSRRRRGAPPFT